MKKITFLFLCFVSFCAGAQNVRLQTGGKITGVSTTSMDMDMGAMGGQMKMESTSTTEISVTGAGDKSYNANSTITKMKLTVDGGPQSMSYDSENKADNTSEMGQEMSKNLNKPAALLIDKITGSVKDASPEKPAADNSNPMSSMMGGDNQSPATLAGAAFFILPSGKNIGDKWTDSTEADGIKAVKTYEFQSLKNGIAVIGIHTVTQMKTEKDAQGMTITINMSGTSVSAMTTDIGNGLVQKMSSKGTMDGTFDIMGQSMPVSMTISSESVFQ